jgi:hypothetical protein
MAFVGLCCRLSVPSGVGRRASGVLRVMGNPAWSADWASREPRVFPVWPRLSVGGACEEGPSERVLGLRPLSVEEDASFSPKSMENPSAGGEKLPNV